MLNDGELYEIVNTDTIPHMMETMEPASVDCTITSPPFPAMFAYNNSEADLGNSENGPEMKIHFGFLFRGIARILKPGRVACIHCMQIPNMKRSGKQGLFDFRGFLIRLGQRSGLVYEYDWMFRHNPQKQAITTKSHQLQFAGLERDRAESRGCLNDYIIKFRAPGENAVPINSQGEVSRNHWIDWAEGHWGDMSNTDTLNTSTRKGKDDTRHICPFSLPLVERLVRLYSNPGEIVFDPFAGIGTVLRQAIKLDRRGYGTELREDWCRAARDECEAAIRAKESAQRTLFDLAGVDS